ncbi:MAG: hypothetical protein Q8P18_14655 [Pseudomonadota bacterium]|nr:hypothetical protein [Pseudomonadota bacterium]
MGSFPFTLLFVACLAALLGARFGLEPLAGRAAASASPTTSPDAVMALPPKPDGGERPPSEDGTGAGAALLTLEACSAMAEDVRDVCLQALARQSAARDPSGALQVCARIADAELRLECESDVAEAVSPIDRDAADRICAAIPAVKWRGQCYFGMGLALAEIDPAYALERCEKSEAFRDFCRHDVVGEVALEGLEPAVTFCAKEEGDSLTRKTCWHGIGKYIARRDFSEAAAACGRATDAWRSNCFHGVGWGAAERDPDATLTACTALPAHADSCRQGVAHQLKRFDPARGIALCESIGTASIRARCLTFLKR